MITITDEARRKLKEIIAAEGREETSIRVDVVRGPHGCVHGWRLALEESPAPGDTAIDADGVKILAAAELLPYLEEATIDHRQDETGLGFSIDVPSADGHGHDHGGGGGCGHH